MKASAGRNLISFGPKIHKKYKYFEFFVSFLHIL